MRYALVKTANNSVDRFADNVDPNVQTKAGFKWLPCPSVSKPIFNAVTEIIDGPTYLAGASAVDEIWAKRNLTAEEISQNKERDIGGIDGRLYSPIKTILLTVVNDARATRAKLNALIDATGQTATVAKYPNNQITQIDMTQLVAAIKALL